MENRKMLSNGVTYFCTSILTQSANLFLIPLYTRNMTQEQYGQYDLIISVQQLLAIAITLGVFSGMIRFFNEFENKQELKNTALTFSILWGGLCIGIIWAINPFIYPLLFNHVPSSQLFIPYIVMSSVISCFNMIFSSFYAMQFKALKSSAVQLSIMITTLMFALYFFLKLDMGVVGILKAQLFGNLMVFMTIFLLDLRNYRFSLKLIQLRKMLDYGTGLLLGEISGWILALSDRFLIKGFMSLSSVAVYSIGYKIGMLINPVFINPFLSVFTSFKFKAYKEADGPERIQKLFRLYNFIGWLCVLGLSLFANVAIHLIATTEYQSAIYLIPIIAFSYFLSGAISFYSLGLHIANKMRLNSMITVFTALINVVCNLILIPWIGVYGSAMSTVIAYVITNAVFYYYGSKYYPLGLGVLYPYKYLVIYIPIYVIYLTYTQFIHSLLIEILLNGVMCIAFILLSVLFKFISSTELIGNLQQLILRKSKKILLKGAQSEP